MLFSILLRVFGGNYMRRVLVIFTKGTIFYLFSLKKIGQSSKDSYFVYG